MVNIVNGNCVFSSMISTTVSEWYYDGTLNGNILNVQVNDPLWFLNVFNGYFECILPIKIPLK